jgi:hypothetical protein
MSGQLLSRYAYFPEEVPKVESTFGPVLAVGVPPLLMVQSMLSLAWFDQGGLVPETVQAAEHCRPSNVHAVLDSKFSRVGYVVIDPVHGQSVLAAQAELHNVKELSEIAQTRNNTLENDEKNDEPVKAA